MTDTHNTNNEIWAQIIEDIGTFFLFFLFIINYNKYTYNK